MPKYSLPLPPTAPQVQAGKLRGLAVTSTKRSSALPDVPTMAEAGVSGQESETMQGILVPAGTPKEIVDLLNTEINAALGDPRFKSQLANVDGTELGGSPADFGKLLADETEKRAKVIRTANIKPE